MLLALATLPAVVPMDSAITLGNDINIPVAPLGVIVLVNFFAPYAVSVATAHFWPPNVKRWISIAIALVLAGVTLVLYFVISGAPIPAWPALLLLGIVVTQTSYSLILKDSADTVAKTVGVGAKVTAISSLVDAKVAAALAASPVTTTIYNSPAPAPVEDSGAAAA